MKKNNHSLNLTAKEMCCLEMLINISKNKKDVVNQFKITTNLCEGLIADPTKIKKILNYFSKNITSNCSILCKK